MSTVGSDFGKYYCFQGAIVAKDGNIYSANQYGQILKIDTVNGKWTIVRNDIYDGHGYRRIGSVLCLVLISAFTFLFMIMIKY